MITHNGKLDLACGDNKAEGYTGIDKYQTPSVDFVFDLLTFPWPIAAGSVSEVRCSHFFEHIPKQLRKPFMEEIHRIVRPGGRVEIVVPLGDRMFQDPTHEWPPVVPGSFAYFDQEWLRAQRLQHGDYVTTANFSFEARFRLAPDVLSQPAQFQQMATRFYQNAALDMLVTLVRR